MNTTHIARFDRGAFGAKPNCICGHPWANHIIPGGVDNLDIYPNQRHCVDCACRDYTEPPMVRLELPKSHVQGFDRLFQRLGQRVL